MNNVIFTIMQNTDRLTAVRNFVLVSFLFVLGNYFFFVVVAAITANSVRFFKHMTMRALYKRRSRSLIVCKSLVRSAFGLFSLGYCHLNTSFYLFLGNVNTFAVLFTK